MDTRESSLGRGSVATADMKARIAFLRGAGRDVIDVLWRRHVEAIYGTGYSYDFAERDQADRRHR